MMEYRAILSRDFNPCWNSLKDNVSVKACIIHFLSDMCGYGRSYEEFTKDFKGKGKVTVEDSQVIVEFSDLAALGIDVGSTACTADLDHMFRDKLTAIADPKTSADKIIALGKIIGTELNGISTTPNGNNS